MTRFMQKKKGAGYVVEKEEDRRHEKSKTEKSLPTSRRQIQTYRCMASLLSEAVKWPCLESGWSETVR